jgi:hypothetical protein
MRLVQVLNSLTVKEKEMKYNIDPSEGINAIKGIFLGCAVVVCVGLIVATVWILI